MTESMQRFAGQVVIVTGASKGIGQATAVAFGREGARVVVNYFSDEAGAQETAAQVQTGGGQALLVRADVSQPADVERNGRAAEPDSRWAGTNNDGII